jgi:hypothetical protein
MLGDIGRDGRRRSAPKSVLATRIVPMTSGNIVIHDRWLVVAR